MTKVYVKALPRSCKKCFACQDCSEAITGMPFTQCAFIQKIHVLPSKDRHKNCPLIKLTPYIIEGEKRWIDKVPTTNNKNTWTIREVE